MNKERLLVRAAREIVLPLLILVAFAVLAGFLPRRSSARLPMIALQRPSPLPLDQDQHFHLLLANEQLRAFSLVLPANSESFVRFEHNFITVEPNEGEIIRWREGESAIQHFRVNRGQIQFFLGDSVLGFRNDAKTGEYRCQVIEFLGAGITTYGYRYYTRKWDYGPSILNPPVDAEGHFANSLDLNRAVASDVQLLPAEFLPASARKQLLVAISAVDLQMAKRKLRLEPGEVLWLEGRDAELRNAGNQAARFALVEFRTADEVY
ncbi:MAG TPA: hypothetical protein VFR84_18115 [Candidatus Angelobacter sp.]|nr:hypothetical protein [Candidatus Angelobacter sp.]